DRTFATDGADSFYRALAEGDATRIEDEYVDSLSDSEQNEYFDEQDADNDSARDDLSNVAPILLQLFGAPYALGEAMTSTVVQEKGVTALDNLFRKPPNSEEGLMNVFALLDNDKAREVATPKLNAGEKKIESGDFGAISWYLVLAAFDDQKLALDAT